MNHRKGKNKGGTSSVTVRQTRTTGEQAEEIDLRPWFKWSKFPPLSTTHPELAAQWDFQKNGPWTPEDFTFGSGISVWWRCPNGPDHVWCGLICARTKSEGDYLGCPFCTSMRVSVTNSLATLFPKVAKQWHPTKNGRLRPEQVVAGSHRRVWWKCNKGPDHEWRTPVKSRTYAGNNCPFCRSYHASVTNSLATVNPKLAKLWHPTKNGKLTPEQIPAFSSHRVWWQCKKGSDHEWQASPSTKMSNNSGCPFCAGVMLSKTNSLATLFPDIARQWHPKKNGKLRPESVNAGSNKKVWWQCGKVADHIWQTVVSARTGSGSNCPYCSGRRTSKERSLAVVRPDLAAEWHPARNKPLTPSEVLPMSNKTVWWCCNKAGHQWEAQICHRSRGRGCPQCQRDERMAAHSLAARFPHIAEQWHATKNVGLSPQVIAATSKKRVWWRCPKDGKHVWQVSVMVRTSNNGTCPQCRSESIH